MVSHIRRLAWSLTLLVGLAAVAQAQQNPHGQLFLGQLDDPRLLLVRDPAVVRDLKLQDRQVEALRPIHDKIDQIIWPARQRKPETVAAAWRAGIDIWNQEGEKILTAPQRRRLREITLRAQGTTALKRDDVADKLKLSTTQRKEIATIFAETEKQLAELQKRANAGESDGDVQGEYKAAAEEGQQRIINTLTEDQLGDWAELLGGPSSVDQLGKVTFRWPGISATAEDWVQGGPLTEPSLAGKVRIVHFFAFGCINCVRNYEAYRTWHEKLADRDVVMIGIHTPETDREREMEALLGKLKSDRLPFPVLMDNDQTNWNAWGNAMWPSVYLVDRHGRIRAWWYGELNWQGAEGQKLLTEKIEQLLSEP
ncbi:MAG: redoxin domain-containing protein [Pirellulaceae bacterium]